MRLCKKGLHDLDDPTNVYSPPGRPTERRCRACKDATERARYARTRALRIEQQRAYREANLETEHARGRAYRQAHPEKMRVRGQTRRARKQGVPTESFTFEQVVAKTDGHCHLCGDPVDLTLPGHDPQGPSQDHIIPLAEDGPHTLENVSLAHSLCNWRKGARRVSAIA